MIAYLVFSLPRNTHPEDRKRINSFIDYGNARADEIASTQGKEAGEAFRQAVGRAAVGLYQAIAAVSDNEKQDPTNLRALWNAVDKLGDQQYAQAQNSDGSAGNPKGGEKHIKSQGFYVQLGPNDPKCNIFAAAVYALGAGIGLKSDTNPNGYPVNGPTWGQTLRVRSGNANVPTTSEMFASGLSNFNFTNSPRLGDIVTNGHHVGIYVGHEIVISATDSAGVNTGPMGTTLAPSNGPYKFLTYGKP